LMASWEAGPRCSPSVVSVASEAGIGFLGIPEAVNKLFS
jgi:hypothetical protein